MTFGFDNSSHAMTPFDCDQFELLSAYLDGEVTAQQRQQVQQWLENDPTAQRVYQSLLQQQQAFQSFSPPQPTLSHHQLSQKVFDRIDEGREERIWFWGGTALATVLIGSIISIFAPSRLFSPQVATKPPVTTPSVASLSHDNSLQIAVNRPIVEIPKATTSPSFQKEKNGSPKRVDR